MNLNIGPRTPQFDPKSGNLDAANALSVILEINRKKTTVRRSKIKDIAKGLAEIAYDLGETNDPNFLAEEMTDVIFDAFQKVARKQKKS